MPALLLYGVHEDGTGLDPDEIRTIRKLASDAALGYRVSITPLIGMRSSVDAANH